VLSLVAKEQQHKTKVSGILTHQLNSNKDLFLFIFNRTKLKVKGKGQKNIKKTGYGNLNPSATKWSLKKKITEI
jgi:hypothetical protein